MKLLPAKLSIPEPPSHVVPRQRLIDLCDISDFPHVLLLQAPAGYGKSTLAAQVLGRFDGSGLWYTLDQRDSDPRSFTAYLVGALRPYLPVLAADAKPHLVEYDTADDAIDDICLVLEEYTGPELCLVLDNYESVADSMPVNEIVRRLLAYSSSRLHFLITSRTRPDIGISKLVADGHAIVLQQGDLAFTLSEVRQAIARRKDLTLSEEELEQFWQDTGGWCVALGLRGRASKGRAAHPESIAALADFVAEEITAGHSPEFVDTLMRAALLPALSHPLCSRLLGSDERAETFLRELRTSPLPHTENAEGGYTLHPMLRDALVALWRRDANPETVSTSIAAAAATLSEPAYLADAIDLCLEYEQYDAALAFIREHWGTLIELDLVRRITDWLTAFPPDYTASNLYISLRADLLSLTGRNQELIDFLKTSYDPASFDRSDPVAFKLWIRYNWARLHTSTEPLYDHLRADWQSLSSTHQASSRELLGWGEYTIACAAYMEMRLGAAEEHINRCLEFFPADAEVARSTIRDQLGIFWHGQGRSREALALIEQIDRDLQQKSIYTGSAARHMYMAWIRISLGELRAGLEAVEQGLEIMRTRVPLDIRIEMYADRYRGVARWYLGHTAEGLEYLKKALAAAEKHNAQEVPYSRSLLQYYSLLSGEPPTSSGPSIESSPTERHFTQDTMMALGVDAAMALREARYDRAIADAQMILQHAEARQLAPWLTTGSFYLAVALEDCGRGAEAEQYWHQGFSTLARLGALSYPLNHPGFTARACCRAIADDRHRDLALRIINADMPVDLADPIRTSLNDDSVPPAQRTRLLDFACRREIRGLRQQAEALRASSDAALAEAAGKYVQRAADMPLPPLRIQTFGHYFVQTGRRQIGHARRNAERIMHILLLEHPRPVHEEYLMEHLWPNAAPASARNNLRTCVKDLRRDLDSNYESRGRSYVVYDDEQYALSLPESTEIDFARFRSLVRAAAALDDTSDPKAHRRLELRRSALQLYKGPLLPGAPYDSYAIDERERLVNEFLNCTKTTAELLLKQRSHREAVAILETGLQTDPLWTDGVQLLMETWVQAGRTVNALRVYRDYARRLESELQVEPDDSLRTYLLSLTG